MKRIIPIVIVVIAAFMIFSGCSAEKQDGFSLQETPQIYVLQGEDSFATMPKVTLYENGSAWLSQPPISSYAIFESGTYEVDGNQLTVTHNDSSSATFEILDGGDTLTLLSANLGFTKVGAVYQYRSNAPLRTQTRPRAILSPDPSIVRSTSSQPATRNLNPRSFHAHWRCLPPNRDRR